MATIMYKLSGGSLQTAEANTLGELKQSKQLGNYQATIKYGSSVTTESEDSFQLEEGMVISFTEKTKGA